MVYSCLHGKGRHPLDELVGKLETNWLTCLRCLEVNTEGTCKFSKTQTLVEWLKVIDSDSE